MKFLTDQDVYAGTVHHLQKRGHDVATAAQYGMSQASDASLLNKAKEEARILVTRDRDFGNLIFAQEYSVGVLYLRIPPSHLVSIHDVLDCVLSQNNEIELLNAFVVIEPGRHRLRMLPQGNDS